MVDSVIYHYPPELLNLLIDTIPLLCRSKKDVLTFFDGAGVNSQFTDDLDQVVNEEPKKINKYQIVRTVLTRLNEKGDLALEQRREIIKRVTQFESFSSCWPDDQLKAKGLVAEIRQIVNIKDSFTKMNLEREQEKRRYQEEYQKKQQEIEKYRNELLAIKKDLYSLFKQGEVNPWERGKQLEAILNRLFKLSEISIRESITVKGDEKEGIVEQIDGVIEIDGDLYLVEIKWWKEPLGVGDVSQHLVRIFNRGHARGIFISSSGYTDAAIKSCKESLTKTTVFLCDLQEIILILEKERNIKDFFIKKRDAAIIDKNPFFVSS
ncbi:conserved hypothetical protein [Gloeothece citriformis PCC 7424]|uniref:Restriction endonuclease type IV Mrr domain-containing protein n=1 Tax=Gloeothece citriformis (strain PCC 7424) TaxID=65393 RepID=B7KCQ9_GLOC7|nr:restriction endonuclease [Gloeothece citriformis]ACK71610.1 conserved hypothetical protein [Gloeothece citriformis PCC 7424]